MEEVTRKIVDAGKQARTRVKQKQQERYNIQDLIWDWSMEVREKYQKETEDYITRKCEQMDTDLQNAMQQEEAAYEEPLNAFRQKYKEYKKEWVPQTTKRTLAMQLYVRLHTLEGDTCMSMVKGAIVAKARSMHREALSEGMYQELLHKKSMAEIAGYLKHKTSYAAALKDARGDNIHRGQLESILRQRVFKKTMKLYRHADATVKSYYRLHMQQIEIDLILFRIRVLISQEYEATIAKFPIFLRSYTSSGLLWLGNVHSYDKLLDVLKHAMYYAVLLPYRMEEGGENDIDYIKIETQLQIQHYAHTFQVIDKVLKGKNRKAIKQYFVTQIGFDNAEKIYRYRKYFDARKDVIYESLVPVYEHLPAASVEELIVQPNVHAFIKLLQSSTYCPGIEDMEKNYVYTEHYADSFLYALAKKNIYYSLDAPLVYSSYLHIAERKPENTISIIEDARYHISIENMEHMLVYQRGECLQQFQK